MRQGKQCLSKLLGATLLMLALYSSEARRVRVRPANEDTEDQDVRDQQVQYYAAQPVDDQTGGVVLVPQDGYGGLQYTRSRGQAATADSQYRPLARALSATPRPAVRAKEPPKQPPVQTIRNYSKVNDDGSFTFGYEAADGSFKEETRGTDCVVRGKYGYVDPDGNKREFTYVSGNPCDPNSVSQEEDDQNKNAADDSGEENVPKGPLRPLRPVRPAVANRPTTTLFQNSYNQNGGEQDEYDDEPQQVYQPVSRPRVIQQPTQRPRIFQQPNYIQQQQVVATPRPAPAVRITPRPPVASTTVKSQLPATTYRPQLLPVTSRPTTNNAAVLYTKQVSNTVPRPTQSTIYSSPVTPGPVDFDAELRKFQLENNVISTPRTTTPSRSQYSPTLNTVSSTARPVHATTNSKSSLPSDAIYQTELVYDPSTGQYNTVLYQALPQSTGDFSVKQRLQPYVHTPQVLQPQHIFQQLYNQPQHRNQQQQQQQQSYPSQTVNKASTSATAPQRFPVQPQLSYQQSTTPRAQAFYYIASPDGTQQGGIAQGQIDAFLRGHNIAF